MAGRVLRRAASRGSPIAQNRLARMFATGRGMTTDPVAAIKWHLIAKAGGLGDTFLDEFASKQTPEVRDAAEKAARPWLQMLALSNT
jgi:TPR repeat protein